MEYVSKTMTDEDYGQFVNLWEDLLFDPIEKRQLTTLEWRKLKAQFLTDGYLVEKFIKEHLKDIDNHCIVLNGGLLMICFACLWSIAKIYVENDSLLFGYLTIPIGLIALVWGGCYGYFFGKDAFVVRDARFLVNRYKRLEKEVWRVNDELDLASYD